ncbi:hypothetical protein FIBSPDRAFT_343058 [Athelia psychrophila]|uniref:ATP-grasp domain-containing protein n=1 Tax=Athelia psychrophila TaxID=1759441 RepID=A0A167W7M8_9AGAM|nr:hypothetical protein FIBSPDRAFT_343058 [Fibularhizoctonia sp. CBS 109695]
MAPSTITRNLVQLPLTASTEMARALRYQGAGTLGYLVSSHTGQWVFLEINPRIQVEYTVTEDIINLDFARIPLHLSNSATLTSIGLNPTTISSPEGFTHQLRPTAENPAKDFGLSPGTIHPSSTVWFVGRGVRIDMRLCSHGVRECNVGTHFDSLLAKIVLRRRDFGRRRCGLCEPCGRQA